MRQLRRPKRSDAHNPTAQQGGCDEALPTVPDSSPPDSLPDSYFPDGVKVLHDCPDATADICFVHGLTGNRESTWTAHGQSRPWPETLLPRELRQARVITYGYDAYVVRRGVVGSNRLIDHATNLLNDLTTDRATCKASSRPIIFVAHSLGGLVCKKAILLSRDNPEDPFRAIFEWTIGIIFMGTPHRGAWMADWARIPVAGIGIIKTTNKSLLEILQRDNQLLESIQLDFMNMIHTLQKDGRSLAITCFYEELPLSKVGMVVSRESATIEGYNAVSIHANHRDMVRFVSVEENGFKRLLGELKKLKSKLVVAPPETIPQLSQNTLNCLKSLAFRAMFDRFHGIERAIAETCEWLLSHERYRSWASSDRSLLWIKGKPGSGKSTLLRHALENQGSMPSSKDDDLVLSFFFHSRGNELQSSTLGFFRSLLHQVLRQEPAALEGLVDTFEQKRKQISDPGEKWEWIEGELKDFFESSLPTVLKTRSIWLFIDALDECSEESAVGLLRWFKSLLRSLSPSKAQFRLCITCRHYPGFDSNQDSNFKICLEHENSKDISTYIQDQLSDSPYLAKSRIPSLIAEAASGIFMWARLVINQVLKPDNAGLELQEIEEQIGIIPQKLDNLYNELIQGMNEKQVSLKLIQWICFATRPLTLDELRWAMIVEPTCSHKSLQEYQTSSTWSPSNDRLRRRIQKLSCGLVEITPSPNAHVVQFIHQSVMDFFLEKGLLALSDMSTSSDEAIGFAHLRLSSICLHYLAMEDVAMSTGHGDNLASEFPLLNYATTSWVTHTRESDTRGVSQKDLLALLAWPSDTLMATWLQVYHKIAPHSPFCPTKGTSLIHTVSRFGLKGLLDAILQSPDVHDSYIDARDEDDRTPLWWASKNGHAAVVQRLLGTGKACVNAEDKDGRTPMLWAARRGHEAIVQQFIQRGDVNLNKEDNYYARTPLSYAVANGHVGVVKLLLATGEVGESKDRYGHTTLWWAVNQGHKVIVQELLGTAKFHINSRNDHGDTLLHQVILQRDTAAVKLLLDVFKAEVDLRALFTAIRSGNGTILRLLLDTNQVEVSSRDNYGLTLLSWAAREGHEAIVRILLDTRQVEVDSRDEYGRTPLSWAARRGYEAVVRILLDKGQAEVDLRDKYGQTPLSLAAQGGHEAVVRILLDEDQAEVDSRDEYGRTPLSWAAQRGHEAVVRILLDEDQVEVDSRDEYGRTPLSWAAEWGHEAVVRILLDTGQVEVDSRDKSGRTPLSRAKAWNCKNVVRLLGSYTGSHPILNQCIDIPLS